MCGLHVYACVHAYAYAWLCLCGRDRLGVRVCASVYVCDVWRMCACTRVGTCESVRAIHMHSVLVSVHVNRTRPQGLHLDGERAAASKRHQRLNVLTVVVVAVVVVLAEVLVGVIVSDGNNSSIARDQRQ